MPRLPGAEELGAPPSGRSGRPIASYDASAIGRGMQRAGQGMRQLGASLFVNEKREQQEADKQSAFDTQTRYLHFEDQQRKSFADAIVNAPVGAEGFTDAQVKSYRKAADDFFATVPDALKPQYRQTLFKFESSLSGKAQEFALQEKDRVAKTKVEDGQNVILQGLQDDPSKWRDADKQAEELVRNSGRSPIDQDGDLRAWRKRRAEALWQIDSAVNGGAARDRLGVGGPPAPVPADVQSRANMARDHFVKLGYSPVQAAGIVGNLVQESGVRSDGPDGDNGTASGVAQWRGARLTKLKRFAASRGKNWRDLNTQLDFIDIELQQDEPAAYARLKSATTVEEATAAFIGFERPRGWSAANPRGGHGWSNRLAAAQRTAGEEVDVSEVAPEYADLPYEDRVALYDKSVVAEKKAANEAAVQLKAQQAAYKDALSLGIETGEVTSQQDILSANIDDGDKATLLKALRTKLKEDGDAGEAMQLFARGALRVDPFDADGRKTVDAVYDRTLKATPPDQVRAVTEEMVRQTGVVPKAAMNSIRADLQGTDPSSVAAALQSAQRLSTVNPAAFGRRDGGGEIQSAVDDFSHYVNDLNMDPDTAAKRIIDSRDPAKQRGRKAIEPAAKEFLKGLQDFDLAAQFDDSWGGWRSDPSLGMTPAQELGIKADFLAIAEDQFYRANGDPDIAKARAVEEMKRLYGVTEFGGVKAVVKHPPEKFWPKSSYESGDDAGGTVLPLAPELGGETVTLPATESAPSLDYARKQLDDDIKALAPDADPSTIQLVTTPETDAMVKRGELPGYAVLYKDKDGVYQTIPGKLWRPDIKRAAAVNRTEEADRKVERERRARGRQEIERAKADQINRPAPTPEEAMTPPSAQDILSGNDPVFGARGDVEEDAGSLESGVPVGGR